jgi:isoamyl acetate esterase
MGIAVVKTQKTPPLKALGWKTQGWNFWNGAAFVAVVCVSTGMGIGIGWGIRSPEPHVGRPPLPRTSPPDTAAPARPSFLFVGDSLTELGGSTGGWVARLNETYKPSVDMLNRGRSGFNTRQTLDTVVPSLLQELNKATPPVFITLWLGANDAALANGPSSSQHIAIDEYKRNLVAIVHQLRQFAPLAKILLITPPVVDDATRRKIQIEYGGASDPLDRTNDQASAYAAACGEVATAVGATPDRVTLLDLHSFLMVTYLVASDRAALLNDGLHFSDAGNLVVYEQINKQLEALLPASLIGP